MAYLGGKSKSADHIITILNSSEFDGMDYIEPFCGYCHILRRIANKSSYTASDNNDLLITLLTHNQQKRDDHPHITPDEYSILRRNPHKSKLRAAYAAFCYSYNGKYFGGYVHKYKNRNYADERKKYYNLLHDNSTFKKTKFSFTDYSIYKNVKNKVIYCDPPYQSTTEYHTLFNSNKFWDDMRKLSKNNYVFISEYSAPSDFVCITSKEKYNSLSGRGATRKRIEKLFIHSSKIYDSKIKVIIKTSPYKCIDSRKTLKKKKL
jgi:DNA adenine methylase